MIIPLNDRPRRPGGARPWARGVFNRGYGGDFERHEPSGRKPNTDGTTTIRYPVTPADFLSMGIPIPSYRFRCQESSGNLTDDMHGVVMTVAGTGHTYQVQGPEATYSTKGISLTDAVSGAGFTTAAANLWDATYQSVLIKTTFSVSSTPASTRALFSISGSSAYIGYLGTSGGANANKLLLQAASFTNGASTYNDSKRHDLWTAWRPGPTTGGQILGHTVSQYSIYTDKEQFHGNNWSAVGLGAKGLGTGGAALTTGPFVYYDQTIWVGSSADLLIDTITIKVAMQRYGWTIPW